MDRPGLVVFDLGGVLVRIAWSWAEACRAAGIDPTGREDPIPRADRDALVAAHETGALDRRAFVEGLSAASGRRFHPDEVARVHDAWLLGEYAGVASVFDALDAAGVPTAVLSNTNAAHWEHMFHAPLAPSRYPALRRVRHPVASHLIGARKPDPAAFRAVEEAAGVRGARVVFFDDLEVNVAGARRAGWTAHVIDPHADPAAQMLGFLTRGGRGSAGPP